MANYRLTPRAQRDLSEIWEHIAADSERAADRLVGRIFDKLELACSHASIGVARPELSDTARVLVEADISLFTNRRATAF
ncbi:MULTISPECIES: type II toxin-antitoxin system RelE/ParE family toxin [unclassified Mesorhizobium]|uniref:type II toxin-antitoxin system RelE/ParE family toxin n=1 Tax=unclassified Mesorhizobium TaxID=325217 RepID=UPI0032AF7286